MKYDYTFISLLMNNITSALAIIVSSICIFTYNENADNKKMIFVYFSVALLLTFSALSSL